MPPSSTEVRELIKDSARGERRPVVAETYIQKWKSASNPVLFSCNDGNKYVLKGSQNKKMIVTDHIAGRLGQLLGAPVGRVAFAEIPEVLRQDNNVSHFGRGLAHATLYIPNCTDKQGMAHINEAENNIRFAYLAILFTWFYPNDPQFIYTKQPPHIVYSVDHGHFLRGGPNWTAQSLGANHDDINGIHNMFDNCGITETELSEAIASLNEITDDDIRLTVLGAPDDWGVTQDERDELTRYLVERKDRLINTLN